MRLHDLIHERMHVVMDLIQLEAGKARMDAFIETMDVAVVARYYGLHGPKLLAGERRAGVPPASSPRPPSATTRRGSSG
jgi:succinate-semialdehyde dehydrogenase / glutarate-semialdehyde dehydrogenase